MRTLLRLLFVSFLPALLLPACNSSDEGGIGQNSNVECNPGDKKKAEDGCNTCSCQQNGYWACSEMFCGGGGSGGGGGQCKPGDKKEAEDGCNTCSCQQNGYWACSEMFCGGGGSGGGGGGGQCKPGDSTHDGCNTCSCMSDGSWVCTLEVCSNCDPQDAHGVGMCAMFLGYAWNGKECAGIGGCSCEGADCKDLYPSPEECSQAHTSCNKGFVCNSDADCPAAPTVCITCADGTEVCPSVKCESGYCTSGPTCENPSTCDGPIPPCAPPPQGCDYVGGGCVNGQWTCGEIVCEPQCKSDSDCPQPDTCMQCSDGTMVCAQGACIYGQCQVTYPTCSNSCKPQDAHGVGMCDAFFGFAWTGKGCVGVNGCSCKGVDCKSLFQSEDACEKTYMTCLLD